MQTNTRVHFMSRSSMISPTHNRRRHSKLRLPIFHFELWSSSKGYVSKQLTMRFSEWRSRTDKDCTTYFVFLLMEAWIMALIAKIQDISQLQVGFIMTRREDLVLRVVVFFFHDDTRLNWVLVILLIFREYLHQQCYYQTKSPVDIIQNSEDLTDHVTFDVRVE